MEAKETKETGLNELKNWVDTFRREIIYLQTKMMFLEKMALHQEEKKAEVDPEKLTIGQAIDMLNEGTAEKVTCYDYEHTYMFVCEETGELRTVALNGKNYPWIIKESEMDSVFRVVE